MTRTIVIGGGIAGLATAALLAREGHEVRLLERLERVGGRAGSYERDGFRFDTGPSWYLMPRVFDHFFEMLGTSTREQLDLRTLDPGYRLFGEPEPGGEVTEVTIPFGADRVARVFDGLEPGSSRTLRAYLKSARRASEMAERYFLYNPFTRWRSLAAPEVILSLPQLIGLLTVPLKRFVSRRFSHPLLRQVLGYPAVFLGTDPRRAPSMYHLMSALDLDEGVKYPMGGFWHLVERLEALAREAGVEIVTGAEVTEILTERDDGKLRVSAVRWRGAGARAGAGANAAAAAAAAAANTANSGAAGPEHTERTEPADIVVSGADLHHTETALLPPEARSYPEAWWRKRVSGPGAVIVMLGVSGELPQLEHHSLFFTRDWDANFDAIFGDDAHVPDPASIYVCRPSASDPGVAPAGHENLFVLIPVPADTEIGAGRAEGTESPAVEAAADRAIAQIAAWADIPDLSKRITLRQTLGPKDFARDYHSWHGGMLGPSHILRQSAMFRAQNQSKHVGGLYYAGATTAPGVGVPMCLISAELVLKRIRGDHSAGPSQPW